MRYNHKNHVIKLVILFYI